MRRPRKPRPGEAEPREEQDERAGVEACGAGAMAAGRDIIGSSTHVHQAVPLPRVDEVDPPRGVRPELPFRTRMFVGRTGALAELDDALARPGGAVVQAVHGLGGVGKSTLAAHWAHHHADEYTLTWWITADSAAAITAGLADLAGLLVPEMARESPAAAAVGLEERAAWARRWLAAHSGWLVVLDNVTRPADVATLVTSATRGRFLITSRLRDGWHDLAPAVIELDVLSAREALEMLRGILAAGRPDADLDGDAELCAELGYLPLAIQQAGAYIRQTHLTPAAYLTRLRTHPAVMYDRAARGSDAERTIARIWHVSLDTLTDTPLAVQLLRIMSWWAPQGIPRTLLDSIADAIDLDDALGALAAYNMITLQDGTASVHRLVQAVARTPDPADPHRQEPDISTARDQATTALYHHLPAENRDPTGWPAFRSLLPHITALTDHADPRTDTDTTDLLLFHTGTFLRDQGSLDPAITYLKRSLAASQRLHGNDHPGTLASRNDLAGAYESAGDLSRAIPLYEATLADYKRVLGGDHPHTLGARHNLAGAYESAGDVSRAIPLYKATLADYERVLGGDHPHTLTSQNNLAGAYASAGYLNRAIPLYEATLADRERVLGGDHPSTLASRNNLAGAYRAAGDLSRAIRLYEATLADCERVLGGDHPHTLAFRNNLAGAYESAGDLGRAIPLYEATLADCERVLGGDHPSTLASRNNLAGAYRAAGDLSRAIPLCEATLADCERVLGGDHPTTRVVRENLEAVRKG